MKTNLGNVESKQKADLIICKFDKAVFDSAKEHVKSLAVAFYHFLERKVLPRKCYNTIKAMVGGR